MIKSDHSLDTHVHDVIDNSHGASLKKIRHKHQLAGQCHIVLSGKQNQIVQIDKPQVPDDEINGALKWQVKDQISIPPEDMIVDFYQSPVVIGGMEKINVVCATKSELLPLVETLNQDKCEVSSIIIEEFAFVNLCPNEDDARIMVCQQPNEEVILIIVKNRQLYFQRRLRGLAKIAQKSEDELSMTVVDSLSLEIQRSTDYYERQLKQAPIKSIEILVPMKNEAFLARKLAENSNLPVNLFTMPEGYSTHREYAVCIGATMQHTSEGETS